jgi:hypothetical protein
MEKRCDGPAEIQRLNARRHTQMEKAIITSAEVERARTKAPHPQRDDSQKKPKSPSFSARNGT